MIRQSRYWPNIVKFYLQWIIELSDMLVLTLQKGIAEKTRVLTFTDWKIVSSRIASGQDAAPPIICVLYFRQKGKLCFIISAGEITVFLPSFSPRRPQFLVTSSLSTASLLLEQKDINPPYHPLGNSNYINSICRLYSRDPPDAAQRETAGQLHVLRHSLSNSLPIMKGICLMLSDCWRMDEFFSRYQG